MNKNRWFKCIFTGVLAASLTSGTVLSAHAEENPQSPQSDFGTPPEKPEGDAGGTPPEKPDGEMEKGADTQSFDYSGSYSGVLSADGEEVSSSNETSSTSSADQNVALVQNGGKLTLSGSTLEKSGDDTDGDRCNFYGVNSIALSTGSTSLLSVSNSSLKATSEGSNGIFATDSGTVYANEDSISTSSGNSRGLDATYGGTILANEMTIQTQGDHSAAVATDRGGGNISITNSSLTTSGSGSPLLYSTGDIEADNVNGTASGSQIAGMEGLNKILVYNSQLCSTNNAISGSDPVKNGVIIYQSTSGDADTSSSEKARFEADNSVLSTNIDSGAMFYVTNTEADVVLSSTILSFDTENVNLLQVEGNDANNWGTPGSNGGTLKFTGLSETLAGNIVVDTLSSAEIYLLGSTTYKGSTSIKENNAQTSQTDSPLTINISSNSTWIVTGDCTVSNLNVEEGGKVVDPNGKTVTIVENGKTVVKGDSSYTVMVTGSYGTSFETDEENALSSSYIDRSDFDAVYEVSTAFSTNTSAEKSTATSSSKVKSESRTTHSNTGIYVGVMAVIIAGIAAGIVFRKKKK